MLGDLPVVLVFAGIGLAVVFFLFQSVSKAPVQAPKAKAEAKAAPAAKKAPKSKAEDKKKKEKEEKELEALIAREAVSTRGMPSAKFEVETLEDHREKAREKARQGKGAAAVAAEAKKEFSEEEKLKERAAGFKVITKEEKAPVVKAAVATHSGSARVSSPKTPAAAARDELDRKLSQFFKANSGKKRGASADDKYDPIAKKESAKPAKQDMRVEVKKTINAASDDAWNADNHQW